MLKSLTMAALVAASLAVSGTAQAQQTQMRAATDLTQYGTVVDIVNEDFSKFSAGSETAPDFNANINTTYSDSKIPYFENVDAKYTSQPRWGASFAYPAGGAVCLYSTDEDYVSHINTPIIDASGHGGLTFIRFRARLLENVGNYPGLGLHVIDFSQNPTNGSYLLIKQVKGVTTEWQEFEYIIYNGTSKMLVNINDENNRKVLIDDVRVQQVDQYVETPHLLPHRAYTGNSFKPAWNKVEGADKYLVNVYNSDLEGNIGDILVENMETADTTCTVRGLLPGNIYRYNVTAVSGDRMSLPTNNAELYDLVTPVLDPVESVEDGKFTATWNKVPNALYYNYYVYEEKPVTEDGDVTVIDENFDNVTDWGGGSFGWTAEEQPTYPNEQELGYLANVNQTGFTATCWAPLQAGYVALDGWNYFYDVVKNVHDVDFVTYDIKKYAKLETPEFDLSKDEGRMHVSVDLWGTYAEDNLDKENNYPAYQVNAIVALCNYDFTLGGYVEAETKHCVLSEAWNTFTADFTKGTENSKIVIYATDGPGFLFVDNLKLTQRYEKGESLSRPVVFNPGLVQPKVDVTLPEGYQSNNYYQRAQAVSQRDVYLATRQYTFYSRLSDPDEVYAAPTAIKDVTAESAVKASVEGDNIVVVGTAGEQVSLHTAAGACVATVKSAANSVSFNAPAHGVYIVKVGTKTLKLTK